MLTLSIIWVVLAAAVTLATMGRRSAVQAVSDPLPQPKALGSGAAVLAVVFSIALIAGFAVVGKFLVSGL